MSSSSSSLDNDSVNNFDQHLNEMLSLFHHQRLQVQYFSKDYHPNQINIIHRNLKRNGYPILIFRHFYGNVKVMQQKPYVSFATSSFLFRIVD